MIYVTADVEINKKGREKYFFLFTERETGVGGRLFKNGKTFVDNRIRNGR